MTAPVQTPPEAAAAFYTQGQTITAAVILALQNLWQQFDPRNIDGSFGAVLNQLVAILAAGQVGAARQAQGYVPQLLGELDMDNGRPQGRVRPVAFIGSSSGLTLPETLDTVRLRALRTAAQGGDVASSGLALLEGIAETQIADTARLATATEIAVRPWVKGWVRMLNPGACSRCVVLAGKFYLWNEHFYRHDRCKCKHIPADEDTADDFRTDPDAYFRSLSEAEQNKAFTQAGAEAIRLGADVGQVVNARRGARGLTPTSPRLTEEEKKILRGGREKFGHLDRTRVYGQDVLTTSEGTTRRASFGRSQLDMEKLPGQRYRRGKVPRLMPESILDLARDREDAIRLLRYYRYIT